MIRNIGGGQADSCGRSFGLDPLLLVVLASLAAFWVLEGRSERGLTAAPEARKETELPALPRIDATPWLFPSEELSSGP